MGFKKYHPREESAMPINRNTDQYLTPFCPALFLVPFLFITLAAFFVAILIGNHFTRIACIAFSSYVLVMLFLIIFIKAFREGELSDVSKNKNHKEKETILRYIWAFSLMALFGIVAYLYGPSLLAKAGIFSKWLTIPLMIIFSLASTLTLVTLMERLIDKLKKS